LRNPFIITFKREVNTSRRYILQEFEDSLSKVDCLKCKMLRTGELLVENEFFCWPRDMLWNAWTGIAEIRISKHPTERTDYHLIKYAIDDSWNMSILIFGLLVFSLIAINSFDSEMRNAFFLIGVPVILSVACIGFWVHLWMQWVVFNRIMKYGSTRATMCNYNWPKIMGKKSDEELRQIIAGKHQLPQAVINIAVEELEKRKL